MLLTFQMYSPLHFPIFTGVVTYPGYDNTQYSAQPMYTLQPGAGSATAMCMMSAPNGAPPAYQQQAQGSALPHGAHSASWTTIKNINSNNNNAQIQY